MFLLELRIIDSADGDAEVSYEGLVGRYSCVSAMRLVGVWFVALADGAFVALSFSTACC